jgi:beta-glucosidase-like glycosyl hydrolase
VANAKHWVNNNQETDRSSVDEEVDERTRFEMYYPPFEGAIAADVGSFMCSYNKINAKSVPGSGWSCENPETLQRDLKDRLGFKGWVMSDWGATHSMSIVAGLDQEMPGADFFGAALAAAVASGAVPRAAVDDKARRALTAMFTAGLFDMPQPSGAANANCTTAAHAAFARETAAAVSLMYLSLYFPNSTTSLFWRKCFLIGWPFTSVPGSLPRSIRTIPWPTWPRSRSLPAIAGGLRRSWQSRNRRSTSQWGQSVCRSM